MKQEQQIARNFDGRPFSTTDVIAAVAHAPIPVREDVLAALVRAKKLVEESADEGKIDLICTAVDRRTSKWLFIAMRMTEEADVNTPRGFTVNGAASLDGTPIMICAS